MKDVTGQNIIYMAALLGNYKMVDTILKFKVKATRIKVSCHSSTHIEADTFVLFV